MQPIKVRVVTTVDTNDADYADKVTEYSFDTKYDYDRFTAAMNELINDIMLSEGYSSKHGNKTFRKKYDDSVEQALGYDLESEDLPSDKEIICETIFPCGEWHTLIKIELLVVTESKIFF